METGVGPRYRGHTYACARGHALITWLPFSRRQSTNFQTKPGLNWQTTLFFLAFLPWLGFCNSKSTPSHRSPYHDLSLLLVTDNVSTGWLGLSVCLSACLFSHVAGFCPGSLVISAHRPSGQVVPSTVRFGPSKLIEHYQFHPEYKGCCYSTLSATAACELLCSVGLWISMGTSPRKGYWESRKAQIKTTPIISIPIIVTKQRAMVWF